VRERGCPLPCLGTARHDRARLGEGMAALRETVLREPKNQDPAREVAARIMLRQPEPSCGCSGAARVGVDRHEAARTSS
jgi:hypothetical protein